MNGIPFSFHEGSDGTFDTFVFIVPKLKKASVVLTNCAASEASPGVIGQACAEIIEKIE
jgi:hypothetical protein